MTRERHALVKLGIMILCLVALVFPSNGADIASASGQKLEIAASNTSQEVESLKAKLAEQQKQLDQLRQALEEQGKLIESLSQAQSASTSDGRNVPNLGNIASLTPMVPAAALPAPAPLPAMPARAAAAAPAPQDNGNGNGRLSPLSIPIGPSWITPIGFMDFTDVFRSTTAGSGIGSNFAGIPYSNTPAGRLTENRFSAQNSRVGIRVDAKVHGASVLGYLESDFLGNAPNNLSVTSNAATMRLRLYWVDVKKDWWEILGGQSWSMLTPNRRGLGALPADIFYSQVIDTNYQVGLPWTRQPQFRIIVHPNNHVTAGVSFENSEQYIGGSAGAPIVTLPTALASPYGGQLDNGGSATGTPNLHPDVVAKIAFDGGPAGHAFHFEAGGLLRSFKVFNPALNQTFTTTGGGGTVNLNFEVAKNLRLIANTYFTDGGGRYLFGTAPDLIIRGDGSIGLLHASSATGGFEYSIKNSLIYAYYGGEFIGRNSAIDPANNKLVGYGFGGSAGNNNRTIQEGSFGMTQTLWRDPKYGALSLMLQYSYVSRNPWFVATGQPKDAHASMAFVNLRYTLPAQPLPAAESMSPGNGQLKSP